MADLDRVNEASSQPESNNFVDDFEQLDPLSSEPVSSTTRDEAEEDLYSGSPLNAGVGVTPMVSFDDEPVQPSAPSQDPFSIASSTVTRDPSPPPIYEDPTPPPAETKAPTPPRETSKSSEGGACNILKNVDPRVVDLIYWRDPKKTGIVFGSMMVLLLSLAMFSVMSVVAYLSLAALTVTISFRVYKNVLQAVQKSSDGHPFKKYLDMDLTLPQDKVNKVAEAVVSHLNRNAKLLRRLFLVEDLVDSIKFGLLLWVLTYIGAWFNGMTLVILATIAAFTLPKVYETNQTQIDHYLDLAKTQIKQVMEQVQSKIPLPGKKQKAQ